MPKAFSEREKELIGKQLLEQGYKLFSVHGFKKTNIEELAEAAGISKGAFYNFYESKDALFMEVLEQTELRLRQEILAVIDLPGPSPRARLFAVFKKVFTLFEAIPILHFFTGNDFAVLFRRIPAEKVEQHLDSDRMFLEELITRCQQAGISIQVRPEQIIDLLYPLVLTILHSGDFSLYAGNGDRDVFLELVAAYCLGEVDLQLQKPTGITTGLETRK